MNKNTLKLNDTKEMRVVKMFQEEKNRWTVSERWIRVEAFERIKLNSQKDVLQENFDVILEYKIN